MGALYIAKIRESDIHDLVMVVNQRKSGPNGVSLSILLIEIPFPGVAPFLLSPAKANGTDGCGQLAAILVDNNCFPGSIIALAQRIIELIGAQHALGHIVVTLPD